MINSLFKKKYIRNISIHTLYWIGFLLFFSIVWGTSDKNYTKNIMVQLYSLPSRLLLVYITLYWLIPSFFFKKKYLSFIFLYILLLLFVSIGIQRPIMLYIVQPIYLTDWVNSSFFTITELMNTILDVNIAATIPLVYFFFKVLQKSHQRNLELEKNNLELNSENDNQFIYLKIEKTIQKILLTDVLLIESLKNHIKVKTTEKEIIVHKSISSIEKLLPKKHFLRIHRSYIINIKFIDSFSPSKLTIKEIIIPIGRKYKNIVKDVLGYY